MLFNSLEYLLFLPIVVIIYWWLNKKALLYQNTFLLLMSYLFYGMWNWKFLFLLVFSTLLDYYSAIKIEQSQSKRRKKFWLILSVGINLGFLGVFKYFNFFSDIVRDVSHVFGQNSSMLKLEVLLPVGISFYTFHGLSYVFDCYNEKIVVRKNFIDYGLFVSFFPLLVAGPIERANHLLPQIESKRTFTQQNAVNGLRQILWGLFKKIVIADNCAIFANTIFDNYTDYSGSTLLVGAVLFAFQIYGDFSGYSDIALGSAKLMGFDLLKNFSFPYFSRNLAEFWKRWHISLSSWFRDYLYIPLGGNKTVVAKRVVNVMVVFLVSGFWHGANWTFIVWGLLNSIFVIVDNFVIKSKFEGVVANGRKIPSLKEVVQVLSTFLLVSILWIFFRAETITEAADYIKRIFSDALFKLPEVRPSIVFILILVFLFVEWLGREKDFALQNMYNIKNKYIRWFTYNVILVIILLFGATPQTFIYFQF
jgi:D-alanyl-lipoteichoic acid acyltransferase DltB (MBOAT superfamily)